MNEAPYLLAEGVQYTVDRPIFIGRDLICDIQIEDATLSRRHACVVDSRAGCVLIDLNSRNGTKVNGNIVQAVLLSPGDTITVGDYKIEFHAKDPTPAKVTITDSGPINDVGDLVSRALKEDTLKLLRSGRLQGEDPTTRLLILYKVARNINACLDTEELLTKVVALAIEVLQADRALIALGNEEGELEPKVYQSGNPGSHKAILEFSRTIAHQCFEEGVPMFLGNIQEDERFQASASVARFNIGTAMCSPLIHRGKALGVLYVDKRMESFAFESEDLKMLAALAEQAALALANRRLYSELKASLERIEQQQEALVQSEKLAAMGLLSAGLSHEIRNPLTVISGNTQLLLMKNRKRKPEERQEMLEAVDRAAEQIFSLVQGLIDFSKKRPANLETLNLNDVVKETITTVKATLTGHYGVKIIKKLAEDLPPIDGDKRELIQVFMNLILNAVQAMSEGGKLTLRTAKEDERVIVQFLDTGPGIPEDQLELIFQAFHTQKKEGTGLGLWIARNIIERVDGTLKASNRQEGGACFEVSLPLAK